MFSTFARATVARHVSFLVLVLSSAWSARATLADLLPQNISISGSPVTAGGSINVGYNVTNQGGTNAVSTQTKIQIKSSSNVLITAPTFSTSAISAFSSVFENRSVTIPAGTSAGTYYAYVIVDNLSQVTQSNYPNDSSAGYSFVVQNAASIPGAPQNLSAFGGNGQVGLGWNAPASNGGATITSYRVFRGTNSSNTQLVTSGGCANLGVAGSCADTGLTNGQSYYYIVSAVNSAGQGPPSNGATATPVAAATIPGAPQNLSASPGNGLVGLGWNAPSSNGGATITSYRVFRGTNSSNTQIVTSGGCANLGAVGGCADTGLTNGQSYYYIVSAVNSAGQGPPSNSVTATPFSNATPADIYPNTISISGSPVTPGGTITVNYTITNSGGTNAPPSHTKIQIKDPSNTQVTAPIFSTVGINANSSITESRQVTIPAGSANGTYNAYVIVDNSTEVVQSNYSNDLSAGVSFAVQSGATIPGAPQNLAAAGGNGQVGLGWNAPASNGGATITSYRVFRGTNSSNTLIVTSGGCANLGVVGGCTDTGLTNGQSYYYIVSAVNSVGQGPPSNSATATPVSNATPADIYPNAISISGSPVTPGGTITVNYTITNSGGTNAPPSHTKVQIKDPSNTQVTAPIFSTVGINANSSITESRQVTIPAGSANGTYNAYVIVDNTQSEVFQSNYGNDFSAGVSFAVQSGATIPGAPQNLAAAGGNGQVGLGWNAPSSNGGATITSYRVFRGTNSSNTLIVISGGCANLGVVGGCTDTGLTNGQSYYYIVSAVNSVGQGPPSNGATATPVGSATLPGAPQNLNAIPGNGQAALGWSPPSSNGGATITNYRVFRGTNSLNTSIVTSGGCANLGATFSCTDAGLTNGQSYYYIVSAVNSVGQGAPSNPATVTPVGNTAPADLYPQSVFISGTPVNPGGAITLNYTIVNAGGTNAPASHTKVVIRDPSNVQVTAPIFSTTPINAGGSINENRAVTIPAGVAAGNYSATVIVDSLSEIVQSNYGNDTSAPVAFVVQTNTGPKPGAFNLNGSSYCNGSTHGVTLTWGASTGVSTYTLLRDSVPLPAATNLPSSQLAVDDLSVIAGVTYTYLVRATNGNGSTDSNPINVFVPSTSCVTTLQPPTALEPGSATDPGSLISGTTPTLRWSSPGAADGYAVTIDKQQSGGSYSSILATDPSSLIVGTSFAVPSGRLTDGSYRWSVRAHGSSGFTSSSNTLYFRVSQATQSCSLSCRVTVPATAGVNAPVSFSATADTTCAGTPAVQWTFGDAGAGASTSLAGYTYKQAGTYSWAVAVSIAGQTCSRSGSIVISPASVPVLSGTVYDKTTSQPILGATVVVGNWQTTSGSGGYYEIRNVAAGNFNAIVSKSGYVTATGSVSIPAGSAGTNHDFPMQAVPPPASPPSIQSINFPYRSFVHFVNGRSDVQPVKVTVDWANHPPGVVWFRPSGAPAFSVGTADSVSRSFDMGRDFGNCGKLIVDATALDGAVSKKLTAPFIVMSDPLRFLGLQIPAYRTTERGGNFAYSTTFGANFSALQEASKGIAVSDRLPFFGKQNLALRLLPTLEATVGSDGQAEFELSTDGAFTHTPKFAKPLLEMAGLDWSFDPDVVIDGEYVDSQCRWNWSGRVGGQGSLEKTVGPYYIVLAYVPLYVKAKVTGTLGGALQVRGSDSGMNFSGRLELGLAVRLSGGVGIDEILSGELYVDGAGTAAWLPGASPYYEFDTKVKIGVELHAWVFKVGTSFYEWEWKYPENAVLVPIGQTSTAPQLMPREYLKHADYALFVGNRRAARETNAGSRPGVTIHDVQTNAFPFSQPSIAAAGDKLDLVWLHDDPQRSSANRTVAVFSTGAPDALSAPRPIADDGTADFHPRIVAFADGTAVAAWENAKTTFADNVTVDQMSAGMEIATAAWNPQTAQWSAEEVLTHNSSLDHSPKLAGRDAGNLLLLWIANPSGDFNGSASKPNELWYSRRTSGTWSTPQKFATVPNAIWRYDVAYDGTTAQLVMTLDTDGDLTTVADHELYLARYDGGSWSALQQLTHDAVADDNPSIVILPDGGRFLIWLRGEELASARDFDVAHAQTISAPGYSSTVAAWRLASNAAGAAAIVWADASGHGSDLFAIRYDPAIHAWGAPEQLTDDEETEKYAAPVMNAKGDLVVICDRGAVIQPASRASANAVVEPSTDLALVLQPTATDVALAAVTLSPAAPPPGSVVTLTARIDNRGSVGVPNADVVFYSGSARAENIIARSHLAQALAPGSSADVSVDWTMPQVSLPGTIIAVIDPDHVLPDTDPSNNSSAVTLALPDLSIDSIQYEVRGAETWVAARVVNSGNAPSAATSAVFRRESVSGPLISSRQIPALDVGASIDLITEIAAPQPNEVYVFVDEANTIAESDETNNIRHFAIVADDSGGRRRTSIPPRCTTSSFQFSTINGDVPPTGARLQVNVTATVADCTWTATSSVPWIQIVDGAAGKGNGVVTFDVAQNDGSTQRSGSVVIAGLAFVITQVAASRDVTIKLPGGVPMTLIRVSGGSYVMGSSAAERGRATSETAHKVTITHDFFIGKYEVTQEQWNAVMNNGASGILPQVNISWLDVAGPDGFLDRLNNHLQSSGQGSVGTLRLPTEAEWELAERAGTQSRFPWGDALECADDCSACPSIDPYLWWCGNTHSARSVGTKDSNAFGIFDMNGNVYEWVNDWSAGYPSAPVIDPVGPATGTARMIRGGGFPAKTSECRSAQRWAAEPTYVSAATGVRIAMSAK